jgi:hypothetical protein
MDLILFPTVAIELTGRSAEMVSLCMVGTVHSERPAVRRTVRIGSIEENDKCGIP